ncbi:Fungalysin metallopeptidase-domain-containing protein [Syncephalis fuscata]|nr:Fungalysin metallopeptidase-domain-containing protein [Syncephalis fuscata]
MPGTSLKRTAHFGPVEDPVQVARSFAEKTLKIIPGSYKVKDVYKTTRNGITHVFLKQVEHGVEIVNADCAIHVSSGGDIVAHSDTFYHNKDVTKQKLWNGHLSKRFVRPRDAFKVLADYIGKPVNIKEINEVPHTDEINHKSQFLLNFPSFFYNKVIAQQSYVHTKGGELESTWEFFVDLNENYFNVHVSADGQQVLSLNDWTSAASYNVIRMGDNDLGTSQRTTVDKPENVNASPNGWHNYGGNPTNTTWGNNVNAKAQEKNSGVPTVQPESKELIFDYSIDLTKDPSEYKAAAVVNLFYVTNIMHDVFYQYGFDEQAGNFQKDNFGKGGLGNDEVDASAQDPLSLNNAYFHAPPDGQQPRMKMYLWTGYTPKRDGDFVNDIIVHEYSHGISSRLTGGPSNANCLSDRESLGMSEGWGDFFSVFLRLKATDKSDKSMMIGEYVQENGIRVYPYSTNKKTNPTSYGLVYTFNWREWHKIGEIWANILYEMYWGFVEKLGFEENKYSANRNKGNTLAVQLVVDAMKLQPCNPTFISGRDAILQAEKVITGGQYKCIIWTAFAKRGVGFNATTDGVGKVAEDTSLPRDCKKDDIFS